MNHDQVYKLDIYAALKLFPPSAHLYLYILQVVFFVFFLSPAVFPILGKKTQLK